MNKESLRNRVLLMASLLAAGALVVAGPSTVSFARASAQSPGSQGGFLAPAIAPDDPATGDPAPPDGNPVPDGLGEPAPVPDETIVEDLPDPGVVPVANALLIAWVGTPADRPIAPNPLLTLQAAINAVPVGGGTVSFDPGDYAFTGALAVSQMVTIDSAADSMIYGRFTVSNGGLALAADVEIGVAATGAVVTVSASNVALADLTIRNPSAVLRPTGVQLATGLTGVTIDRLTMDGGGQPSSYGVNLTTSSAVITDPDLTGIATGIVVTAAATTGDIEIDGGQITAATSGISLGTAIAPEVTGTAVTSASGAGTGIDLANSSAAVVDSVTVTGFARGIGTSPTSAAQGPTITDPTILDAGREGISLGATQTPSVVRAGITGTGAAQSTGILVLNAVAADIDGPVITGMMYGITAHLNNAGTGPTVTSPRITAFGAITLGSTQGATVTDAVLDAGPWGDLGTGLNLVNAGRVTVAGLQGDGFLYAIGSQSSLLVGSDRRDIIISDVSGTGAPDASSGIYLLGAIDPTITGVEMELTGAALVIHQSTGVEASDVVVHGRAGLTSTSGGAILRAYGSQGVDVDGASIDAGSYGFFYSGTDGATIQNATVENVVERAIYGRSVANLDVTSSTFAGNAAVGLFVITTPADGLSHDIAIHDNVMTDNLDGIHVLQGTTGVQIEDNTVSGQPSFVAAGVAHDVLVAGNSVDQVAGAVAISVAPLWQDVSLAGSYSSSGIRVLSNTFTGGGTWVSVGSPDPSTPDATRRTLRDAVLVTGNAFPAASTAVEAFANAVDGDDTAVVPPPPGGPVAVDARDYGDPNDWDAVCLATGYLDGALYYDGGGAVVFALTAAPVLYPRNCIDLSLTQAPSGGTAPQVGELVTWTLIPHNAGPRVTPPGWSVTQLLPPAMALVSITGTGYLVAGSVATSSVEILVGADGPPLTVVARIVGTPAGVVSLQDVAYIAPAATTDLDGDGFTDVVFERMSPLVVPTISTDAAASPTDNDAGGIWTFAASAGGLPSSGANAAPIILLGSLLAAGGILLLGSGLLGRRPIRLPWQ